MSKIGKKEIKIPDGVEVNMDDNTIFVKGPKGTDSMLYLSHDVDVQIKEKDERKVMVVLPKKGREDEVKPQWGLTRALLQNMIIGVTDGHTKELEIQGVGYKVVMKGKDLVFTVGFSHEVVFHIPDDIEVVIDEKEGKITIRGVNKQKVGEVAAKIIRIRPADPYKGKGLRYFGEVIKLKEGKKASGSETT